MATPKMTANGRQATAAPQGGQGREGRSIRSLMLLSLFFHLLYAYSIFDIYFTSPVVHPVTRFTLNDTYVVPPEIGIPDALAKSTSKPSFVLPDDPMFFSPEAKKSYEEMQKGQADDMEEIEEEEEALEIGDGSVVDDGIRALPPDKMSDEDLIAVGGFMGEEAYRKWTPPAKRLVLIVGDGLRADTLFKKHSWDLLPEWAREDLLGGAAQGHSNHSDLLEYKQALSAQKSMLGSSKTCESEPCLSLKEQAHSAAPFLQDVAVNRGTWGVSHTRVPTESRPGHVALIAGMYEDVSAVTKGWKLNPIPFDSLFNQSTHTFAFGSPDILPMFAQGAAKERIDMWTYNEEDEDFTKDATHLDIWVLDQLEELFARARSDPEVSAKLREPGIVFFLHLLGLDTTGHTYRPFSTEYIGNTIVVDAISRRVEQLMDEFYEHDNKTAYIFSADHGMSTKGNHGDGDPDNTRTPLVAWGAGINAPTPADEQQKEFRQNDAESDPYFRDWVTADITRFDVDQADITPLMATLIGLPYPANSEGRLPWEYLNVPLEFSLRAMLACAQGVLEMYRVKHAARSERMLLYTPFPGLDEDHEEDLPGDQLVFEGRYFIGSGDLAGALKVSKHLLDLSLEGNRYLQTYDWLLLCTIITLGYLGSILHGTSFLLQRYVLTPQQAATSAPSRSATTITLGKAICFPIVSFLFIKLALERSSPTYFAYSGFAALFWMRVIDERGVFLTAWRANKRSSSSADGTTVLKLFSTLVFSLLLLELIVIGYLERLAWSFGFLVLGLLWPLVGVPWEVRQAHPRTFAAWSALCIATGTFTISSLDKEESIPILAATGVLTLVAGTIVLLMGRSLFGHGSSTSLLRTLRTLQFELVMIVASTIVTAVSAHSLQNKLGLPLPSQIAGWAILLVCLTVPFVYGFEAGQPPVQRIAITVFAFAPLFTLLSIRDEALFFSCFAMLIGTWARVEGLLYAHRSAHQPSTTVGTRSLTRADVRVAMFFLFFLHVGFFGTGNIASISSFYLSPVYRLVPVFSPFLMAALLIFKIMVPFLILCSSFQVMCLSPRQGLGQTKNNGAQSGKASHATNVVQIAGLELPGASPLVLVACIATDVLALNFLFAVRDTGSWLEIGQTITHFVMANLLQVFMLALTAASAAFIGAANPANKAKTL